MGSATRCALSACTAILAYASGFAPASAQSITVDGSFSAAQTLAGPNYTIGAGLGKTVGSNLFHSFGQFNLNTGESANFTGPAGIQNILSRVTGGSRSSINGQIQSSIAGANLYLVNPAGILFGPNASLSVSGAFHATTADYIKLADGMRFTATPGPSDSTLTTAAPAAFGFLGANTNKLEVNGTPLTVSNGMTLSFVAGDLDIHANGANGAVLSAPRGTVNLGSVGGASEFNLGGTFTGTAGGTISIAGQPNVGSVSVGVFGAGTSQVSVNGDGAGRVRIIGGTLNFTDAYVTATNTGGSAPIAGAGVTVAASGDVTMTRATVAADSGLPLGNPNVGGGGSVSVTAANLTIQDGASNVTFLGQPVLGTTGLGATAFGVGNAGNIDVTVAGTLTVKDANGGISGIISTSTLNDLASGSAGNINVQTQTLQMSNFGQINTGTAGGNFAGGGRAGNIMVTADTIAMSSSSFINSSSGLLLPGNPNIQFQSGRAGDILVRANQLTLTDSLINATTAGPGRAGDVRVEVAGSLVLQAVGGSSSIASQSNSFDQDGGMAGSISVQAGSIDINGLAFISTSTLGGGSASLVSVSATGAITIVGAGDPSLPAGIFSVSTAANAVAMGDTVGGNAGAVNVTAGSIAMSNVGQINTSTAGDGAAGTVTVTANNIAITDRSSIGASTFGNGDAGTVTVNAGNISLSSGGNITTTSFPGAGGKAGNITVVATGAITMTDFPSYIQSQSLGNNAAGTINVSANTLTILKDAAITSDTRTDFDAGSITVNVAGALTIDGTGKTQQFAVTGITSDAVYNTDAGDPPINTIFAMGNAGNVTVNAGSLLLKNNAAISSNTNTSGNAGSVTVNVAGALVIDGTLRTGFDTDFTAISSVANNPTNDPNIASRAGNVTVNAGSLTLLANGQILADTYTNGDAGKISVTTGQLVINGAGQVVSTGIISDSFSGDGKAGSITVNAGSAAMSNLGQIATETDASGAGGAIMATFGTLDMQSGATISSSATDFGNAGSVLVMSPGIITMSGANTTIQSRALGQSDAGPVTIIADQLILKDGAAVTTQATVGGGGNITMHLNYLLYLLRSSITTTVAGGSGSGGDIFIDPEFVILNNSTILAQAFAGNGGNITIIANHFLSSNNSIVSASSQLGINGQISISSPDTDVTSGTVQLPAGLGSEAKLDQRACVGPGETPTLSLVPVGRGGLVLIPDASQADPAFLMAGRDRPAPRTAAAPAPPAAHLAQFAALPMAASATNCVR